MTTFKTRRAAVAELVRRGFSRCDGVVTERQEVVREYFSEPGSMRNTARAERVAEGWMAIADGETV